MWRLPPPEVGGRLVRLVRGSFADRHGRQACPPSTSAATDIDRPASAALRSCGVPFASGAAVSATVPRRPVGASTLNAPNTSPPEATCSRRVGGVLKGLALPSAAR